MASKYSQDVMDALDGPTVRVGLKLPPLAVGYVYEYDLVNVHTGASTTGHDPQAGLVLIKCFWKGSRDPENGVYREDGCFYIVASKRKLLRYADRSNCNDRSEVLVPWMEWGPDATRISRVVDPHWGPWYVLKLLLTMIRAQTVDTLFSFQTYMQRRPCITFGNRVILDYDLDENRATGHSRWEVAEFGSHLLRPEAPSLSSEPGSDNELLQGKRRIRTVLQPDVWDAAAPGNGSIFAISFESRLPYHITEIKEDGIWQDSSVIPVMDGERLVLLNVSCLEQHELWPESD